MADKVLVVDDELEIRDVLSKFLTEEGYEVIEASNGEEAIELAERENPQVILLDNPCHHDNRALGYLCGSD
jgi:CheY-like chemotaxis protein